MTSARDVSPQRLVHYRGNWYLDAWCHLRNDLRTFAVDGIRHATIQDEPAREVSTKALEEHLAAGYGIVRSGRELTWAKLRFSAERARWVAAEAWHPDQRGAFDACGRYTLEVPYRDDRELVLEIMKHGPEVEVLAPRGLREKIATLHLAAAKVNGRDDMAGDPKR